MPWQWLLPQSSKNKKLPLNTYNFFILKYFLQKTVELQVLHVLSYKMMDFKDFLFFIIGENKLQEK